MLRIDAGTVRVFDADPWSDAAQWHHKLAYVPGEVSLWPQLSGGKVIDLLGGLDPARRDRYMEMFTLDPTRKCRAYSKGDRRKAALISALSSNVTLLLLDEPTAGLDPLMDTPFRECVHGFRDAGGTIPLSSHILGDAEALADRITIIRSGRVIDSGSLAQLRHLSRTHVSAVIGATPDLSSPHGLHNLVVGQGRPTCEVEESGLAPLLGMLAAHGVRSLTSQSPTLEGVLLQRYRTGEDSG